MGWENPLSIWVWNNHRCFFATFANCERALIWRIADGVYTSAPCAFILQVQYFHSLPPMCKWTNVAFYSLYYRSAWNISVLLTLVSGFKGSSYLSLFVSQHCNYLLMDEIAFINWVVLHGWSLSIYCSSSLI